MAASTPVTRYSYEPDYAVPPGQTLQDTLDELGMEQRELATRTGLTPKTINLIINGHAPLTHETAILLERATGVPARMWNNLEMNYRETLARIDDRTRLEADLGWLDSIPTKELIRRKVIPEPPDRATLLLSVLQFFGVSSPDAWNELWRRPQLAYRKSSCFESQPGPTSAWLRLGELEAHRIRCGPFDRAGFRAALDEARKLTIRPLEQSVGAARALCAAAGVAVVVVREFKGCTASGVARWLTADKALIQLSLRHKTDDHFWFTFFHEAGHVLNDGKKMMFIDEEGVEDDESERQADRFAANLLIPAHQAMKLRMLKGADLVTAFAASIGIAPGIVVGRLQNEGVIPFTHLNSLKRKLVWPED